MIFIINKDLFVEYVNEPSLKYLKVSKEEIIGKPFKVCSQNLLSMRRKNHSLKYFTMESPYILKVVLNFQKLNYGLKLT
jgi:hypothetical protein